MSDERRDGVRWNVLAPILVVVLLLVIGALFLGGDDDGEPTAAPSATAAAEPTTLPPTPGAEPTQPATSAASSPPATEPPALPDDASTAAFVDAHGPADHSASGDVDGDGIDEVVLARVRNDTTHIVVGTWDGDAYTVALEDDGGSADRVDGLDLQSYDDRPGVEIVTLESVGEAGASLSIWGFDGSRIARQVARGGCWDGFHHYGISGATIEPGEIVATCDGSPLPPDSWTSDVYQWDGRAWAYVRTDEPGG